MVLSYTWKACWCVYNVVRQANAVNDLLRSEFSTEIETDKRLTFMLWVYQPQVELRIRLGMKRGTHITLLGSEDLLLYFSVSKTLFDHSNELE